MPEDPLSASFVSEASSERARALHASYKQMMLEHFLEAIDSAAEGLDQDLAHIRSRIEGLDPKERFSPGAYEAMTRLAAALQSGNVTDVADSLKHIQVAPDELFHDGHFRIDSALSEVWERSVVLNARHDVSEGEDDALILRPILDKDPSHRFTAAFTALQYLEQADRGLADEFREYIARVKLFTGRGYLGFSSPQAFGAIYMRLPDENPVEYFLEHLVHELSHLDLNLLMAHDPLLENPTDRHDAPLREEQRPLFQVLHATYVLGRNVRVTRRIVESGSDLDCKEQLADFERDYANGYRIIEGHARWTDRGRQVFETLETPEGS
jgi:hypothetical protein